MTNWNVKNPNSSFAAQYPYNHATITRSGHEIDIDDTPGAERLKISHTKGTFIEIDSFGRWTQVVNDKASLYYKDGLSETVDGHRDLKIGGTNNINVDGSVSDVTSGNRYLASGGDNSVVVGGSQSIHINHGKKETIDGDNTKSVLQDEHNHVVGDQVNWVSGTRVDVAGGPWSMKGSPDGIDVQTLGIHNTKCAVFTVQCAEFKIITPTGIVSIGASGISFNTFGSLSMTSGGPTGITSAAGGILVKSLTGSTTVSGSTESFTLA
jgi:hypothetical protein